MSYTKIQPKKNIFKREIYYNNLQCTFNVIFMQKKRTNYMYERILKNEKYQN